MTVSEVTSGVSSLQKITERLILSSRVDPVPGWIIMMELGGINLRQWLDETYLVRKDDPELNIALRVKELKIIRGLIRGMKYLQSKGIMHSDLKPDNILFTSQGLSAHSARMGDEFPIKIADLGLSRVLLGNELEISGERRGNLRYQAPEVQTGLMYSLHSEIYSIGLIIFEVLVPLKNSGGSLALAVKKFSTSDIKDVKTQGSHFSVESVIRALFLMLQSDKQNRLKFDEFQNLDFDWIQLCANYPYHVQKCIRQVLEIL
jgi:serine/threonine protein kinase